VGVAFLFILLLGDAGDDHLKKVRGQSYGNQRNCCRAINPV